MGWTFFAADLRRPTADILREELFSAHPERMLDCAVVHGVAYMAYRSEKRGVLALVILTQRRPRDQYNFGYKDMDEFMGPGYAECPARILKRLDPLPEPTEGEGLGLGWARTWRAACWEKINKRQTAPRLTEGCRIKLAEPLKFRNGDVLSEFTVRMPHGKPRFYAGYTRYSFDHRQLDYTVEEAS